MQDLREKVAYLQGLSKGLDLSPDTKEGRVLTNVIDVLEDVVSSLDSLWVAHQELEEYMETIDEDLCDLEAEEDNEDGDYIEVQCPRCHDMVYFDADVIDDDDVIEVTCPNCDEVVFINDGSFDFAHAVLDDDYEDDDDIDQATPRTVDI